MILTDESLMSYGKHRGTRLIDVPADYLLYIYREHNLLSMERIPLKEYIEDNLAVLNKQAGQNVQKFTRE